MPRKPLKPCNKIGCPNLTRERYCEQHKQINERSERDKYYDRYKRNKKSKEFYNSTEWMKVRHAALVRDKYLCVHCLKSNRITKADVVDHIIPITVDWSKRLSLDNLQSLCHTCHNRKTAEDKRKYEG
jgi:5-methylcytosine-specific restriction enzyme A